MTKKKTYDAVVIGASAGGLEALSAILPGLPDDFPLPVIVVQHISPHSDNYLSTHLNRISAIRIKEADEKETLQAGTVYIAPPNYHLLIESDSTLSLTTDEKVNYSRPSIDVLFESACWAFSGKVIALILTGANHDGSEGAKMIHQAGGMVIVQDPFTAQVSVMPESVIKKTIPDQILKLEEIASFLIKATGYKKKSP